jgi:hypothetical protein
MYICVCVCVCVYMYIIYAQCCQKLECTLCVAGNIIFFSRRHNISCSTHQYSNLSFLVIVFLLSCFVKFVCLSEVIWHIHVYCRRTWHSLVLEVHLVFYLIVWVKLTFQILEIKLFTVIFSFKFSPFNVISNSYLHVRILFFPMLEVKSVHWCACMPRNESFTNVCACVWKN